MCQDVPDPSSILSLEISTTRFGYGPPPDVGDEVEQILRIFPSGRIRFIRCIYEKEKEEYRCSISRESAADIFKAVTEGLKGPIDMALDTPAWLVTISTDAERHLEFNGSIVDSDLKYGRYNLSGYIRRTLAKGRREFNGRPLPFDPDDCILFDGECDHPRSSL